VWNRPGNVHDSHGAIGFLRTVLAELRDRFGRFHRLELRLDDAFFSREMLGFLDGEVLGYAIKVPLWKWLGVREKVATRKRWERVGDSIDGLETTLDLPQWERAQRVVVCRKRVFHEAHKNFQLHLFDPDDGHFAYSAFATNTALGVAALWHFMAGRGGHEKTLGELKQSLAFDAISSRDQQINAFWQQIVVLAHNLVRSFQLCLEATARPRSRKRSIRSPAA
jgi:hypothetical protein